MSEMIERVAAIIERDSFWSDEDGVTNALEVARAAIEAMREPTEGMVRAAEAEHGLLEGFLAEDGWRTMIDAATAEDHFARLWRIGVAAALKE